MLLKQWKVTSALKGMHKMGWQGLIKEYEDFLPVTEKTPRVTLHEGNTPLIYFPHLSEQLGIELYGKYEGLNPTGTFKDRGMLMAVAKEIKAGSNSEHCASTFNTSAAAAAYAAKAGMKAIVVIPKGKVALGKLAQAVKYGAEIVQIAGNFDDALKMVQNISENYPVTLVDSVNPYRLEGQKTDRKSTRLNSSHVAISYAVFCLKKKITSIKETPTQRIFAIMCIGGFFNSFAAPPLTTAGSSCLG